MARNRQDKGVTLVAATTEFTGDLRFRDQLYVNGHVIGNILAGEDENATVIISEAGSVTGEIRVPNVVINGRVEGNVYAPVRLELAAKARVKGNVYYQLIEMQLGAMVDGQLLHDANLDIATVHAFPPPEGQDSALHDARQERH